MPIIEVKTMSVNRAWQGRRFKTPEYRKYERKLIALMPEMEIPEGKLSICYEFGFSSASSDIDNPVKLLQDILQKRYGFDDKRIYKMTVIKTKVSKGNEYLKYELKRL